MLSICTPHDLSRNGCSHRRLGHKLSVTDVWGTTHAHRAALCTSNLGSRCHHLDTVMERKRFTADRLCEPAKKAQAKAIEEYNKYKDELDIKIECRYHNLCMCQPAAFCIHTSFLFLPLSLSLSLSLLSFCVCVVTHNFTRIHVQVCPRGITSEVESRDRGCLRVELPRSSH